MKTKIILFFSAIIPLRTQSVRGSFVISVNQIGSNVTVTGAGTVNTSALSFQGDGTTGSYLYPRLADLVVGPNTTAAFGLFHGVSGPSSLGSGAVTFYPRGSGDIVGVAGGNTIDLPANYASGAPLIDDDVISNQTLVSLGLAPGTYLYTWGSGPTADSLTINIGVVPEPASAALIAAPVAIAMLRRRGRHLV